MPTLKVAGQTTDFTADPNKSLKDILLNNWPPGGASGDADLKIFDINTAPQGVKILTKWYDGSTFFEVAVLPAIVVQKIKTLGAQRFEYRDFHDIHVFAKGNNGKDKRWKMEKEIENIINTRVPNPITGVSFMGIVDGPVLLPNEDPQDDMSHSKYTVYLYYHKVVS